MYKHLKETEAEAERVVNRMIRDSLMHKRDFEMIARIVKANAGNRRKLAEAFALELAQIAPAFDRAKFLRACGVKLDPPAQGPRRHATPI